MLIKKTRKSSKLSPEDASAANKLLNTCHKHELVQSAIRRTLADLGLQFLDLYLIHWPVAFKEGDALMPKNADNTVAMSDVEYVDTWKAVETLVSKGLIKNIDAKPDDLKLIDDKKLGELSKKCNKTPAQVLIRYQMDHCHTVIPKSVTKSRIGQNIDIFDFKLSPEDIEYIDTFDCSSRICPLTGSENSPYYPF
ncbi:1,5-anhydro-D-fructose reductase [Eufriesea mexicana]|nr:1,5-anhydro-D-fructose reductase [Eufriesea mexicana]